ncbi:LamG domain-containing protein [Wenyingzhuangia sp. IMCC45533]
MMKTLIKKAILLIAILFSLTAMVSCSSSDDTVEETTNAQSNGGGNNGGNDGGNNSSVITVLDQTVKIDEGKAKDFVITTLSATHSLPQAPDFSFEIVQQIIGADNIVTDAVTIKNQNQLVIDNPKYCDYFLNTQISVDINAVSGNQKKLFRITIRIEDVVDLTSDLVFGYNFTNGSLTNQRFTDQTATTAETPEFDKDRATDTNNGSLKLGNPDKFVTLPKLTNGHGTNGSITLSFWLKINEADYPLRQITSTIYETKEYIVMSSKSTCSQSNSFLDIRFLPNDSRGNKRNRLNIFLRAADGQGNYSAVDMDNFPLDQWVNVIYTLDTQNGAAAVYWNGVRKKALNYGGTISNTLLFFTKDDQIVLGNSPCINPRSTQQTFKGLIDDISYYPRALTVPEIDTINQ